MIIPAGISDYNKNTKKTEKDVVEKSKYDNINTHKGMQHTHQQIPKNTHTQMHTRAAQNTDKRCRPTPLNEHSHPH